MPDRYSPNSRFREERFMPDVQTLEDAIRIAEKFLAKYYAFRTLNTARKENGTWFVEFNVGVLYSEIAQLRLDAENGAIIEYSKAE